MSLRFSSFAVKEEGTDKAIASGSAVKPKLEPSLDASSDIKPIDVDDEKEEKPSPKKPRQRAAPVPWSDEELKALLDAELKLCLANTSAIADSSPLLRSRGTGKLWNKLVQRHAAAVKALDLGANDTKAKLEAPSDVKPDVKPKKEEKP